MAAAAVAATPVQLPFVNRLELVLQGSTEQPVAKSEQQEGSSAHTWSTRSPLSVSQPLTRRLPVLQGALAQLPFVQQLRFQAQVAATELLQLGFMVVLELVEQGFRAQPAVTVA